MSLLFQSAVATAKREIMSNLPIQHKLGVLQGLVVEQPVQFCPLCRGVAVFVLDGDRKARVNYSPRCQMSRLYSAMVRSEENMPALAMFTRHLRRQPMGSQA